MADSIFAAQFQASIYQLVWKLMDDLEKNLDGGTTAGTITAATTPQTTASVTTGDGQNQTPSKFADLIQQASQRYGVSTDLVNAVIKTESNYNPQAVSSVGAMGLMQLMPGTASSLGVTDPMNPAQNIDGGVHLLSNLLKHYNGKVDLAVAAYNAGSGAVDRYQGIPPYQETQTYVKRILSQLGQSQASRLGSTTSGVDKNG